VPPVKATQPSIQLLRPADDALAKLPRAFTVREITCAGAGAFSPLTRPMFVKPADQKLFTAGVYLLGQDIPGWKTYSRTIPS